LLRNDHVGNAHQLVYLEKKMLTSWEWSSQEKGMASALQKANMNLLAVSLCAVISNVD